MSSLEQIAPSLSETGLTKIGVLRKLLRAARADESSLGDLPLHVSATVVNVTVG